MGNDERQSMSWAGVRAWAVMGLVLASCGHPEPRAAREDPPPAAERAFRAAGYHTRIRPSPWRLGANDASLARALIDGWGVAASDERPEDGPLIRGWAERRRAAVTTRFGLKVGHVDLLALPPKPAVP